MKRQSIIVLAVLVLVVAFAIATIWTQLIPEYRVKAEVRVRPIIPYLVFRTEDSGAIPFYDSFVNTQVSIMRSLPVLQRVLDQQEVQKTKWCKDPRRPLVQRLRRNATAPMERLRDTLSVRARRGTEIVDVAFMDPNAEDAKLILNTVLDQYMRYVGEKSDATKDKLYRQLIEKYKSLENEILGREKVCAELRRSLGTGNPQELISIHRIRLDETQACLRELRQSIAVLEWERKRLQDLMKRDITDDGNDVAVALSGSMQKPPIYHEDAEWRKLDIDVRTIQHSIATTQLEPTDPDMIRAKQDLEFAEELLRLRETQLDEQWRDRLRNAAAVGITTAGISGFGYKEESISLEHRLARTKHDEQLLHAELEKQQAEFRNLFESAHLLDKENAALQHKRQLFEAVRQRLDQKTMERSIPGPIEVLTQAFVPSKPHKDHRIWLTAVALALGLGIGAAVAFLRIA